MKRSEVDVILDILLLIYTQPSNRWALHDLCRIGNTNPLRLKHLLSIMTEKELIIGPFDLNRKKYYEATGKGESLALAWREIKRALRG